MNLALPAIETNHLRKAFNAKGAVNISILSSVLIPS